MANLPIVDHLTLGSVVLSRLDDMEVPKALTPHVAAFKAAHNPFEKAAQAAEAAKKKRDDALDVVGAADVTLDGTIDPLADKMIGAGLGTRRAAFGDASSYSPTKLKALPYKREMDAVRELVANVHAKSPPAEVKKCLEACSKAADASEAALEHLSAPQAAYTRAMGARDALLVEWTRSFAKLKVNAKAAWHDDKATFASVFAPAEKVQRPVAKRKKAGKSNKKAAPAPVK